MRKDDRLAHEFPMWVVTIFDFKSRGRTEIVEGIPEGRFELSRKFYCFYAHTASYSEEILHLCSKNIFFLIMNATTNYVLPRFWPTFE